jgi:hypothetical protein
MSVVVLPSANQIIRQFADFPDVDMRFANKAAFEASIANVARIPDGWMAYCVAEKNWFFADKAAGTATAFGTGTGGASSFAELEGSPDDNPALAGKFITVENAIDDEATARAAADDAKLIEAKAYADLVATDVLRFAGNWDASVGTYPTTGTGTGGNIRRGDCYDITVAGTIDGNEYEVGDQLRAKIAIPGQTTANWASGQVNSQQATTTKVGIARMGTNSEALAASNPLLMSNPVTVKAQIGDEKKSYVKETFVLSVMEIIFPMELAGQFTALLCSTAMSNLQYKIGAAGTYTTFSTPVSYAAGAEIYLKWDYTSPTEQRGWIRMKGKDS